MSIAVSTVVRASAVFGWLRRLCCVGHLGAATGIALAPPGRFPFPWYLCALCLLCAGIAARGASRGGMARQIDVSGLGQIRLAVYPSIAPAGAPLRLLPGSTLWPQLLVLRLGPGDGVGPPCSVLVFPDSVAAPAFRALALASRAIAGQHDAPSIDTCRMN